MYRIFIFTMMVAALPVLAESVTQTDWSGGIAEVNPVTEWDSCFVSSSGISYCAVEGQICISSLPLETAEETEIINYYTCASIAAGDLDDDGDIDLAATSTDEEPVILLLNNGSEGWETVALECSFGGALWVDLCDMDGNGTLDVLCCAYQPSSVVLWLNMDGSATQWEMYVIDYSFTVAHSVQGCDVNGDGLVDILGAATGDDEVAVWYNNGGAPDTWQRESIDTAAAGIRSAEAADIDGDGEIDVVGALFDLNQVVWWQNSGSGWTKHVVSNSFTSVHHASTADVDGDGDIDVLGAAYGSGRISWWENMGGTPLTWEEHDIAFALTGALMVWPADIDGDGDMDAAATGWIADRIMWYENVDGAGESWVVHTVATGFNGAWPVLPADVDGDGCLELAAGADVLNGPGVSHGLSTFEVCRFQEEGHIIGQIMDTGCSPQWASTEWESETASGTSLSVSWRTSNDPEDMGSWMNPMYSPGSLSGLLERYVQYRIDMQTSNPSVSPVFEGISLNWDPMGVGGSGEGGTGMNVVPLSNPCSGAVSVSVSIPGSGYMSISAFDMAGREAAVLWGGYMTEGTRTFSSGYLPAGVYTIHTYSLEYGVSSCRFVVLAL